tara:strand:- start:11 stop:604 length:594 start_codon:yes stop_codon:yes gene_type:complete
MNLTTGTKIKIDESVFEGSWKRPKYAGDRTIVGTIIKDSYGNLRGQHTFTIEVESADGVDCPPVGKKIFRKGRTLYKNAEVLSQPENHEELAEEKSRRATEAKNKKHWTWIYEAEHAAGENKLYKIPQWWWRENPDAKKYVRDNLLDGVDPFDDEVPVEPWSPITHYTCYGCGSLFYSRSPECRRCGDEACDINDNI